MFLLLRNRLSSAPLRLIHKTEESSIGSMKVLCSLLNLPAQLRQAPALRIIRQQLPFGFPAQDRPHQRSKVLAEGDRTIRSIREGGQVRRSPELDALTLEQLAQVHDVRAEAKRNVSRFEAKTTASSFCVCSELLCQRTDLNIPGVVSEAT